MPFFCHKAPTWGCLATLCLLGAQLATGQANHPAASGGQPFRFVAFGDMPYHLPADYARFENLIREVNRQDQVFNVHVGDIKSSETDCSDASFRKILAYFNQFEKPLIYTPGDNEWTACNKHAPGKYDIDERLATIRKLFFDGKRTLGKATLPLTAQAQEPAFARYVENNCWTLPAVADAGHAHEPPAAISVR